MQENIIGEYQCVDDGCQTSFKVSATVVSGAYDGWVPVCPICGTENEIEQVGKPKNTA